MQKAKTFTLLLSLTLALLVLLPIGFYWVTTGDYYGRKVNIEAPNFSLVDTQNQPHSLEQHRGKFTFLYFGYLNCDDICHNQVGVMFNINNHTPNKDLDFIFITMDPKRDSKEMLNSYFNQLGANFTALTANSMKQIQSIANTYKSSFQPNARTDNMEDYEISHPGSIFLINPDGRIEIIYQNAFLRYDHVIEDLNKLRAQYRETGSTTN